MKPALGWAGRILLWMIIFGCCAILALAVLIPRIGGATPYTIMTGSMRPSLPPGTLAVIRPTPVTSIGVGTVITYQLRSGDPTVATHRVVAQGVNSRHQVLLRTKGDANDTVDAGWVQPVQVKGTLWYAIPYLGYPARLLTGQQHRYLTYLAAVVLLGYAGYMFGSAVRDRRRARRQQEPAARTGQDVT
ncbi:signal peptidase I [Microlunatus soli]|uniref:Signal peptidase I n=1 Tax=Microlunatus soli TaxID=630515 RepID=A0A1H1VKL4_9ACTN|nr:signal peptidase I [Microlunatus soli]SDS84579.1 signal peptidase, endoplasmic reticulum-type [Microlunatus soli]